MIDWSSCASVERQADIVSNARVFRGTELKVPGSHFRPSDFRCQQTAISF